MNISSNIIIFTTLATFFLVQATGVFYNRLVMVGINILLIGIVIVFGRVQFKKIKIIKTFPVLIILFFLVSFFTTIYSVDITNSVLTFAEWVSVLVLVLLLVKQNNHLDKLLPSWIIFFGVILCLYSILLNVFQPEMIMPKNGYQLVFSKFGSHNHLGDFLVIPLLICFYYLINAESKLKYMITILFFLPFFLLSFSRSAYLSFSIAAFVFLLMIFFRAKKKISLIIPMMSLSILITITVIFFLGTVYEARQVPKLQEIHQTLVLNYGLRFKHFNANRFEFANSAIQSIKEHPWLGIGSGNFIYASEKFSTIPNYRTHSSHNIFLDIFAENGIFALFLFISIIIIVLKKTFKNPSLFSLLFISLLVNFQTDYTFRIIPLLFLFTFFVAIIMKEEFDKG